MSRATTATANQFISRSDLEGAGVVGRMLARTPRQRLPGKGRPRHLGVGNQQFFASIFVADKAGTP